MSNTSELNRSSGPSDPPGDWVPSPFPPWTPPEPESPQLSRTAAEELGRNIQSVATAQATMDARLLELIGEFDAGAAIRHFDAIKSTAHWLGWACSMAPGTAREHVRVARTLRTLPRTRALLAEGRLTYSKVRELTRIAELMDEDALCAMALEMTASQLARTVRAYRSAPGQRLRQQARRALSWHETDDGMIRLSVRLPAEEAALLRAALDTAVAKATPDPDLDPDGDPQLIEPTPPDTPAPDRVQALLDVAAGYLAADTTELADDRHLVVVHVAADQLTEPRPHSPTPDVPAGTPHAPGTAPLSTGPAGTPARNSGGGAGRCTCFIEDVGTTTARAPIEAATAARLACTGRLLGAVVDREGSVLALGRTKRRASRAQRRALRIRDHGVCQFPGCHQTRHLDAHHIKPWNVAGPTDLDNLILLCRRHHICCHEGGITIHTGPSGGWQFRMPDHTPVHPPAVWQSPDGAYRHLLRQLQQWFDSHQHQPPTVFPPHAGAGFSLHECVRVLFDLTRPNEPKEPNEPHEPQDEPMAA